MATVSILAGSYSENQKKYIQIGMNYAVAAGNAKIEELMRRCREDNHQLSYSDIVNLLMPTYTRYGVPQNQNAAGVRDAGSEDGPKVAAG